MPTESKTTPPHVLLWPERRVEMAFRFIPPGTFRMGSRGYDPREEPIHEVQIVEGFWVGETPVTQAQFGLWTKAEGVEHKNHFQGRPDHPAENMDWWEAVSFCAWLMRVKADELPEGYELACLPTEAEWEYACRAGTDTDYWTGDGEAALEATGWYGMNSSSTKPVGRKAPNWFGLSDMHGNVWEWCQDACDGCASYPYRLLVDGDPDPGWRHRLEEWRAGLEAMTQSDKIRVLKGGSWDDTAGVCRSAIRSGSSPGGHISILGFRVCLVRGPATVRGAQTDVQAEAEPGPGDGGRGTRP